LKKPITNKDWWSDSVVGPEFKPQHHTQKKISQIKDIKSFLEQNKSTKKIIHFVWIVYDWKSLLKRKKGHYEETYSPFVIGKIKSWYPKYTEMLKH
jgi:hypothetical protein